MKIIEARLHDLLRQVTAGEISFSRMAELINEEASASPPTLSVDEALYTKETVLDFAQKAIGKYIQGNTDIYRKGLLEETLALFPVASHQARQQPDLADLRKTVYEVPDEMKQAIFNKSTKVQQPVRKTLDECKDEIAKEYGHLNWCAVKNKFRRDPHGASDLIAFSDEANKRFYKPRNNRKTLKECKDEAVKSIGLKHWPDWKEVELFLYPAISADRLNSIMDRAMELFASNQVSEQGWGDVKDRSFGELPDFLILFDNGDIMRFMEDNHPFAVITHWMPFPNLPPKPKPIN